MTFSSARDWLADELAAAITDRDLETYFQPQIDVRTGAIVAVEGLSRWQHPTHGMVPPSDFVPIAETSGVIHDLGRFSLRDCCRYGRSLNDRGIHLEVAVNVSPVQVGEPSFIDDVERELEVSKLDPDRLILEITEAEQIEDVEIASLRLEVVRGWGVTVSIDDFGTGFSSVERATGLHAGEVKIDRTLVARMQRAPIEQAVHFAHENGMRVVAEGIETQAQLDLARETGCDRAQGYFFAAPAPRSELERWMRTRNRVG